MIALHAILPVRAQEPAHALRLQLTWFHNAEFAGFYAADQEGFYAREALDVEFLEGSPEGDLIQAVVEGRADIGTAPATRVIQARAEGLPLRAVAVLQRRNPVTFITLKESGITRPQQFAGKTIFASVQSRPYLTAVANKVGLDSDQYKTVDLAGHGHNGHLDFSRLLSGEIAVWIGYIFDEAEQIKKAAKAAGLSGEVNLIHPDNYGVHNYGLCIFTTEQFISEHPDVISRFLDASLKEGWSYVIQHPETVGPLVAKYAKDSDPAIERAFFAAMIPLINSGEDKIGWMKPEVWAEMAQSLQGLGVIAEKVDPADVYTMDFLRRAYNP